MKPLSIFFSVLFSTFLLFSCSKNKDDVQAPKTYVVEGTYTGKIGSGISIPDGHFALIVKSNGLLDRIDASGSVTATGTWQLSGSAFTGQYQSAGGVKVDLTGTLTESQKRIQGNWSSTNGKSGKFHATKE